MSEPTTQAGHLLLTILRARDDGEDYEYDILAIEAEARAQGKLHEMLAQEGEAEARAAALAESRRLVDEQAEDEGLWFIAETAAEAYLQQELRRLHAAVEGDALAETPEAEPCDDPRCGLSLGHEGGHWRWYGVLAETPEAEPVVGNCPECDAPIGGGHGCNHWPGQTECQWCRQP